MKDTPRKTAFYRFPLSIEASGATCLLLSLVLLGGPAGCADGDEENPDTAIIIDLGDFTGVGGAATGDDEADLGDDQGAGDPGPDDQGPGEDEGNPGGDVTPPDTTGDDSTGDTGGDNETDTGASDTGNDGCLPDCQEKECGDDNCGDVCGECEPEHACTPGGQCEPAPGTCAESKGTTFLPWTTSGTTTVLSDNSACGALGAGGRDAVFAHYGDGEFKATLSAEFDGAVHATTTCGAADTCLGSGDTEVVFSTSNGSPVYVTVDGKTADDHGEYSLLLESCSSQCTGNTCHVGKCGKQCACDPGSLCQDGACEPAPDGDSCVGSPHPVPALPLLAAVGFDGYTDSVSCEGDPDSEEDQVWVYNPPFGGTASVFVSGAPDARVRVATGDCSAACDAPMANPSQPLGLVLLAGTDYFFILESGSGTEATLTVSECAAGQCSADCPCPLGETCQDSACVAPTTGDTCEDAAVLIDTLIHSTAALGNQVGCAGQGAGVEAVVTFTAPTAGSYQFTTVGPHGLAMYRLGDCSDPTSCVGYTTNKTLNLTLVEGETASLAIEEIGDGPPGGFEVSVANCTAACAGQPCDHIACGALCGCGPGDTCIESTCVVSDPGDSCESAIPLNAVPAQVTGSLDAVADSLGCGAGKGLGTPDSIYRFTAPATGVFQAAAIGTEAPIILLPTPCTSGGQSCAQSPTSKALFAAHKGDEVLLAVDGHGDYTLTLTRVFGAGGALGSACATDADCVLSDACVMGVCTVACSPDGSDKACVGAASGPRGAQFGCPADVCVAGEDGCATVCLAGVGAGADASCASTAGCSNAKVCAGFVTAAGTNDKGACVAAGTLAAAGQSCSTQAECASGSCIDGSCRDVCVSSPQCPAEHKCLLTPLSIGPAGTCAHIPGVSVGSCSVDADCVAGACEGSVLPSLLPEFYCVPTDGVGDPGSTCNSHDDCQSGACLFAGVSAVQAPYCQDVCATTADCSEGFHCRSVGLWDNNTPGVLGDDASLPICVKGTLDATCPLVGPSLCDDGLVCSADLPTVGFGTCSAP
ncbi:MAG: hypothetical protein ACI9WU_002520 [Myxococcota bacterium]